MLFFFSPFFTSKEILFRFLTMPGRSALYRVSQTWSNRERSSHFSLTVTFWTPSKLIFLRVDVKFHHDNILVVIASYTNSMSTWKMFRYNYIKKKGKPIPLSHPLIIISVNIKFSYVIVFNYSLHLNNAVVNIYVCVCVWKRQWHPTPVLLPRKSHGRRSLVCISFRVFLRQMPRSESAM